MRLLASIKYNDDALMTLISQKSDVRHDPYEKMLLNETLFNARITKRKFTYFKLAVSTLFVVPLILLVIRKSDTEQV